MSGRGLPGVFAHCLEGVVEKLSLCAWNTSVFCPEQNQDSCPYLEVGREGEEKERGVTGKVALFVVGCIGSSRFQEDM